MSNSSEDNRVVYLISQEGESFDVPVEIGKLFEMVKSKIDENQGDEEAQEISLPNVRSAVLAKVIEFALHYAEEPMLDIEKVSLLVVNVIEVVVILGHYLYCTQKTTEKRSKLYLKFFFFVFISL